MNTSKIARTTLGMAILATSVAAYGQQTDSADSLEPIDNITIIGRQGDVADVPGSAHVMDAEALAVFNDTDIMRVLRAVPGVYVQEEEGFGLRPNIGIRGATSERSSKITLMEDGRWMCRLCCAILGSKSGVRTHLKSVHLKERNHACQYCGRRFGNSSHARRHEKKCSPQ